MMDRRDRPREVYRVYGEHEFLAATTASAHAAEREHTPGMLQRSSAGGARCAVVSALVITSLGALGVIVFATGSPSSSSRRPRGRLLASLARATDVASARPRRARALAATLPFRRRASAPAPRLGLFVSAARRRTARAARARAGAADLELAPARPERDANSSAHTLRTVSSPGPAIGHGDGEVAGPVARRMPEERHRAAPPAPGQQAEFGFER